MKNPYLFLLTRELVRLPETESVHHGYGWLYEDIDVDIVHLHWPELLVKSRLPDMSRLDLLQPSHFDDAVRALEQKKSKGARIVMTIHNEIPHKGNSDAFETFYGTMHRLADGFIHMGQASREITEQRYPHETAGKPSFLIPHGNYRIFENTLTREQCRNMLSLNPGEKLLLSFGAIRSASELDFGIRAFKKAAVRQSVFMMAGQLPHPYRSQPAHFRSRKKLYANFLNRRIRTAEKVIAPAEVQIYLNAADLLFIQRLNTLNSGNVALGYTFGKVVTGPDYGVIGEELKKCGNPVFDPFNIETVAEAIRKGFSLSESGHGEKNRDYSAREMGWDLVAKKTLNAYHQLLKE